MSVCVDFGLVWVYCGGSYRIYDILGGDTGVKRVEN
jgi:hypothetical protein